MASVAMTKRSAGYVVPASEWNQLIDNDEACAVAQFTTAGDLFYATGSRAGARLGIGTAGYGLFAAAGAPEWGGAQRVLDHDTADHTVANNSALTAMYTYNLAGGKLTNNGVILVAGHLYWTNTTGSAATAMFKLDYGTKSMTLYTRVSIASGNTLGIEFLARIIGKGASSQRITIASVQTSQTGLSTLVYGNYDTAAIDNSLAQDIKISCDHDAASASLSATLWDVMVMQALDI